MFTLKHTLALACVISTTACSSYSNASNSEAKQEMKALAQVTTLIEQSAQQSRVPGVAVAYVNEHELQWVTLYGNADQSNAVKETTLFNIASLTKPVFSMMTMQLVENGTLSLDESLSKYWVDPDVEDDDRHQQITARLALSHQTGFTNWRGDKPLAFMFDPGQRHEYSGEGFDYLRKAIEKQSAQTMPQLMAEHITKPLNMNDTYFGWQPEKDALIAARYDESAQEIEAKPFYHKGYSAACCTLTTINDYSSFIEWVAKGANLSETLLSDIQTSQAQHDNPMEFFGLGWRLVAFNNTTYLMHDGREPGVRTFTTVSPDTGEGLVIFTNSSNGELLYRPLIKATLNHQQSYLSQMDKDTWLYLTSVPKQVQPRMLSFISQSPSFVSKALYAANDAVFSQADTKQNNKQRLKLKNKAEKYIAQYTSLMVNQKSDGKPFLDIMNTLSQSEDDSLLLQQNFEKEIELKKWVSLLGKAASSSE